MSSQYCCWWHLVCGWEQQWWCWWGWWQRGSCNYGLCKNCITWRPEPFSPFVEPPLNRLKHFHFPGGNTEALSHSRGNSKVLSLSGGKYWSTFTFQGEILKHFHFLRGNTEALSLSRGERLKHFHFLELVLTMHCNNGSFYTLPALSNCIFIQFYLKLICLSHYVSHYGSG